MRTVATLFVILAATSAIPAGEQPAKDNPAGILARIPEADSAGLKWRLLQDYFDSKAEAVEHKDLVYAFSFVKNEMSKPTGPIPEDSNIAIMAASGWFTGIYNREAPFLYISRDADRNLMLAAYLAQYYVVNVNRVEKLEPTAMARLMPFTLAVSLMSWLDLSPVETARIYPILAEWGNKMTENGLPPGIGLLLELGAGPDFPKKAPEQPVMKFKTISKDIEGKITVILPASAKVVYNAQEQYAYPENMRWLEPIGMVIENVNNIGWDAKAISDIRSRIELYRGADNTGRRK